MGIFTLVVKRKITYVVRVMDNKKAPKIWVLRKLLKSKAVLHIYPIRLDRESSLNLNDAFK